MQEGFTGYVRKPDQKVEYYVEDTSLDGKIDKMGKMESLDVKMEFELLDMRRWETEWEKKN